MKNVLERFDKIVDLAYKVNKKIYDNNYVESSGYGPRFRKMLHKNGNRILNQFFLYSLHICHKVTV